MTIISARKAGPTMPEALRRPATATTTPAMLNSTSNPCGSANARSAARDRRTPGAGASTADTGRSGSGDGDDVDGMAALLPWWRSRGGYPWPPRETTPRRSAAAPEPFDGGRAELPQVGQDQVRRLHQLSRWRIAAVGHGHHPHPSRRGRSQAVGRVLDRGAAFWRHAQPGGRLQIDVGGRLAAHHLLTGCGGPEATRQPGLVEDQLDNRPVGRAGQTERPPPGQLPDDLHGPIHERQL